MRIEFRWYDLWSGGYIDWPNRIVYVCLVPMIVFKIKLPERHYLIWGKYYKERPIGCCTRRGMEGVNEEEPGSRLV